MTARTLAVVVGSLCLAATAHADPRSDIAAKAKAAMASYDSMDYELARKQLAQALAIAKKARLEKDPIVARVYVDLAITQLAGSSEDAARASLVSAVQIDPKIAIDAAYKSPDLVRLLDEARAQAGIEVAEAAPDGIDCKALRGIQYTVVEAGKRGAPPSAEPSAGPFAPRSVLAVEAWVGGDAAPARVAVMYRPEGAVDFSEAKASRQGSCKYAASIPASATQGNLLHYYIAAYDTAGKVLAAKGSSGAPQAMAIGERRPPPPAATTATASPGDGENPLPGQPGSRPADVAASAAPGARPHRIRFAVSGGTGVGYVTGRTESNNAVQSCCIGSSPVVVSPELAYYVTPRLSLGLAGRLGFPIGANISGHSKVAPAGLLRARYAFSPGGSGLGILAELGGGILRNTLKLDAGATAPGMDTDIVAQGPLLVGAGIGYTHRLSSMLAVFVDLEAIAGIAVVNQVGSAVHLNTGISGDLKLGIAVGF